MKKHTYAYYFPNALKQVVLYISFAFYYLHEIRANYPVLKRVFF